MLCFIFLLPITNYYFAIQFFFKTSCINLKIKFSFFQPQTQKNSKMGELEVPERELEYFATSARAGRRNALPEIEVGLQVIYGSAH